MFLPRVKQISFMRRTNRGTQEKDFNLWWKHSRDAATVTLTDSTAYSYHGYNIQGTLAAGWLFEPGWRIIAAAAASATRRVAVLRVCNQTASVLSICPMNSHFSPDHVPPLLWRRNDAMLSAGFRMKEVTGETTCSLFSQIKDCHLGRHDDCRAISATTKESKYYLRGGGGMIQFIITMASGLNHRWRRHSGCVWSIALSCSHKHRSSPLRIN